MQKIYLDNAATTQPDPRVLEAMNKYLYESFGNPSSIHAYGRETRIAIEESREKIAELINADPGEIYFTSNGTEANNFAIFGIVKTEYKDSGKSRIITTLTEHHCVLDPTYELEKRGYEIILLKPGENGSYNFDELQQHVNDQTSLVSIMHINNETGTINNIADALKNKNGAYLHTDAVQSVGKYKLDVKELKVDAMAGSSHKFHGPKGSAFLYAKSGTPLRPMLFGGSQERNRRGGTENTASIIGMTKALEIAHLEMNDTFNLVSELNNRMAKGIENIDSKGLKINGNTSKSPFVLSLTFLNKYYNCDAESMLIYLDINGIAASNGAACTSGVLNPSHVILAMGSNEADAQGTIRFSFSKYNTIEEIDYTLEVIEKMAKNFRRR